MVGKRRVAQAVRLAVRLRRSNVGSVVGGCSVHGGLVCGGAVGRLVSRRAIRSLRTEAAIRSLEARALTSVDRARLRWLSSMRRGVAGCSTAGVCCETSLTLLDLAHDAATVWGLADLGKDRAHGFDEVQAELRWSKLESSLDDIVAVRVAHELLELLDIKKLLNHERFGVHIGAANTLLNDVGAELLLGELGDLTRETLAHWRCEGGVVQVKDVLNDVVTEGILYKLDAVIGDLADQIDLLET